MAKIDQFINGEVGLSVRTKVNKALQSVAFSEMETGAWINDDTFATATATTFATSASIKNYVDDSIGTAGTTRSYTFISRGAGIGGENFVGGYYDYSTTDSNLSNASTTQTLGTANVAYGAHAFCVAGGAGSTDGSDLVLTVSGTSFSGGVRTPADSEVIVLDCVGAATDQYFETTKKWIGQVVYTLSSTGGATFSFDFNYGLTKYDDWGNRSFVITDFEAVGFCDANDSGFDIQLLEHTDTGWTYAATGFVAGSSEIVGMNTDYSTEKNIAANQGFAYKRTGLSVPIDGTGSNGFVVRITTGLANTVTYLNVIVGAIINDGTIT